MIKYYVTNNASKITFSVGQTAVVFSISMNDWKHLLSSGTYNEHEETNMVVNDDFFLRTWTQEGERYLFFKYFEASIHTPLDMEADQKMYYFFESINKVYG